MGSPANEKCNTTPKTPQRQVTISRGFWIGVYPVTQEQWQAVMGSNPSHFSANPAAGETQEKRPVEDVSWYDVLVFANRLSLIDGLTPAYSIGGSANPDDWGKVPKKSKLVWKAVEVVEGSTGWRLPTEAQWEYAARAGTTTAFSNGAEDWEDEASLEAIGWFPFNSGRITHEVGRKQPNAWGLYDIHGNVWEWCWDWHDDYPAQAQTDPAGAPSGSMRVKRGGSGGHSAQFARSAAHYGYEPFMTDGAMGFRLARP